MAISAMSTTSSLDIIAVLAPFSDRSLLPSWCPNWFALDGTTISRRTNYLLHKSPLLIYGNREKWIDLIPYLTTFGTEARFTVARDVLCNKVLRLRGLLLDHITAIIPSHIGNGKDFAVAAEPSLAGSSRKNPYGTEYGLVTAIAKSLVRGGRDFIENIDLLKRVYIYWGESCQNSWFFTATDLTDHYEYSRRWVRAAGLLPIQGRSFAEWVNRQTFSAGFMEGCRECAKRRPGDRPNDIVGSPAEIKIECLAFMSTWGGYVGWAYNRAGPGDSIYFLAGCSVPVVLRPRAGRGYTIVGYAYVEGVMRGQSIMLDLESREGSGSPRLNWVDIKIY
ncbi:hypothetical protein NA56DRAFT_303716 [Hyaloscypha hepaticicola]|uniref:Heterokaryon incompatibility domain-containing protein n=1 Tax=Hyaloscypha hepaticicola TaxID=2082293 RepID=A0A2J6PS64_9HELO|nr:hypothetical protein NA56DRAFT_303716 [Hyaloscypha hepaticicola]